MKDSIRALRGSSSDCTDILSTPPVAMMSLLDVWNAGSRCVLLLVSACVITESHLEVALVCNGYFLFSEINSHLCLNKYSLIYDVSFFTCIFLKGPNRMHSMRSPSLLGSKV